MLARYLAHLVLVTGILAGLYLAVDAPERLQEGIVPLMARIPMIVSHVLPVAAAAALVSCFHGLGASGAVDLMLASGIPWRRILGPALLGGALAAGIEAGLATVWVPAALGAAGADGPGGRPSWILEGGDVFHVGAGGEMRAWRPGVGPVDPPPAPDVVRRDLDDLALRSDPASASTPDLARTADLVGRLGHDPRPETAELWTRLALPLALVALLAVSAKSVRRKRSTARSAASLVLAIFVGWICLALAIQLVSNGAAPPWIIPSMPAAAVGILALSPLS